MAYPNNPYPAHYKYYNGSSWVEYYFRTSADLVGETGPSNGDQSYARKFVTNKVYVNGVAFAFANLPTSGAVAEVTITGANIVGGATVSSGSLNYITANDKISVALGKLDQAAKAAYDRSPDVSGLVPYTGATANVNLNIRTLKAAGLEAGYLTLFSGPEHDYESDITIDDQYGDVNIRIRRLNSADYEDFNFSYSGGGGTVATQSWVTTQIGNLGTAASKNYTTSVTNGSNDLVTSGAVYTAISALPTPMQFKGTLGTGGTVTSLPAAAAANNGYVYKVITAGTYQSIAAKVGDTFVSNGTAWVLIPSGDEPSGTVTNVATGSGLTGGPITSSGTISLATAYGDTVNPYGAKAPHYVLAGPSAGSTNVAPSFRALVASDIPDLSASYLPRNAGSDYPLFGDLYMTQHSIHANVGYFNGIRCTSGPGFDYDIAIGGDGYDNPVIQFTVTGGSTTSYAFYLDATNGGDGTIAVQSWVDDNFSRCQAGTSFSGTPSTGDIWIDTN